MAKYVGKFYHDYIESFLDFIVPKNKKVFIADIDLEKIDFDKNKEKFDYVIISDVLGYIEDIQEYLNKAKNLLEDDGRIVITQYNSLWEPILRIASKIGLRKSLRTEQNWLSIGDIDNFARLVGMEKIKSGTKMILPLGIPILSFIFNKIISNLPVFNRLGIFHYVVLRKTGKIFEQKKLPSVSIVIAARNEAGNIEKNVEVLPELGDFTEIIFVEGNSTDNTYDEIVRVAEKYKNIKKIKYGKQDGKGKGDAVRKGFDMAEGDILMIYDADMTVPGKDIEKFYNAIVENRADFINGSRLVYPLEKESMRVLNIFFIGEAKSAQSDALFPAPL